MSDSIFFVDFHLVSKYAPRLGLFFVITPILVKNAISWAVPILAEDFQYRQVVK